MTTLVDKSLLSGGDNKPPLLERHLYDSWKSIMELYMMNRPHGRMISASVEKVLYSGLIIPVFQKGDDPIDAINHMMSFLTVVVTSRYPTTNNQLRNSSNPRQQATINDGRVTVQPIKGRTNSYVCGIQELSLRASGNISGNRGLLHVTIAKGKDTYQASGQILHVEELAFLADPGIPEGQAKDSYSLNAAYIADDLDEYDSVCDETHTSKVALMRSAAGLRTVECCESLETEIT
ncbi:hypothetical protein Tco_1283328 [Tanacetum coccineum]